MPEFHELSCTPSPAGLVFECLAGCGRRLVVDRATGSLTVIDRGDQYAQHRGSHSDLTLAEPHITPG
jgi:hypothetical protein